MKRSLRLFRIVVFSVICSTLLFGREVNAYIDPSVMTYMIQAIAGI